MPFGPNLHTAGRQLKNISGRTVTLQRGNLPTGLYFLSLAEDDLPAGQAGTTEKLVITD